MTHGSYAQSDLDGRGQRGDLWQLPDGRWRARYRDNGRSGKRHQRTHATKREAEAWLRAGLKQAEKARKQPVVVRANVPRDCDEGIRRWVATLDVKANTKQTMTSRVAVFGREYGARLLTDDTIPAPDELEAWRLTISPGWRADVWKDVRQMLNAWKRWGWITANPTDGIRNKRHRAAEVEPMTWPNIWAVAGEIDRRLEHVPIVAAGSGLRPEEWLALDRRRDVDIEGKVIHVRFVYTGGTLTELSAEGSKTRLQRRRVPMRQIVADALLAMPPRIDTSKLVPPLRAKSSKTGYLNLDSFRDRYWHPAFDLAGLPRQKPYAMRHTYATDLIAAGIGLFELSRRMGTSVDQIDRTYGHLIDDSEARHLDLMDAYDLTRKAVNE